MEIKEFDNLDFKEVNYWLNLENDINECIYIWKNKDNNKKYVGQAKSLKRRIKQHLRDKNNDYFHNSLRKYSKEKFTIAIIHDKLTFDEKNEYEKFYIEYYDCYTKNGNGYNIASGGHNGNPYTGKTEEEMIEIRKKISDNSKKQWGNMNDEERKKQINRLLSVNPNKPLGYFVVDIINKTEHFENDSKLMAIYLNCHCGNITLNCQHNRDNDNLKLIYKQYLCFYKDDYTSLDDVLSRYEKQIQNELYQKQLVSIRNDLLNVLNKIKNRKIKQEQQIISIDEYGNIIEYDCANQAVNNLNTHVGAVYNSLNEQKESYINNTFYYFIKKIDFKSDYNYIEDLQNKRKELEQKQEEKVLNVIAIDNKYNKEYLRIEPPHDKYLRIKEKCDNTFNRKHSYCNNVIDNIFYIYQTDESLINKKIIEKDFKIYNKLNRDCRDASVIVIDLQNNQKNIYSGINECAKQINGNRSSVGKICNETDKCCTHRYKNGQYLIYFKTQWESIPYEKQQEIIKLGKHIK